ASSRERRLAIDRRRPLRMIEGFDLPIQVGDQELGKTAEVQVENHHRHHVLKVAPLVAQAIHEGLPKQVPQVAALPGDAPDGAKEREYIPQRRREAELLRKARTVKRSAEPSYPREIGARLVDALQYVAKIRQHLASRAQRDEIQ